MENPEFYKNRLEAMKTQRFEQHHSLQRIADDWGITRERVHQCLGLTGHGIVTEGRRQEINACKDFTSEELAERFGLSIGTIYKYRRGTIHRMRGAYGDKMEAMILAKERLQSYGWRVQEVMEAHKLHLRATSTLGNDVTFSVVSAKTIRKPPSQLGRPFYTARIVRHGDFLMVVFLDVDEMFAIPTYKLPTRADQLRIVWPEPDFHSSKWLEYRLPKVGENANI